MIKVYLAGPIYGLSYGQATEWRDYVTEQLAPEITAYSPLRGGALLSGSEDMDERELITHDPMFSCIVGRDFNDVRTCDLVFVNLSHAKQCSIGTIAEMAAAYAFNKPIVLVMDEGNIHDRLFVTKLALYWVKVAADDLINSHPGTSDAIKQAVKLTRLVLLP